MRPLDLLQVTLVVVDTRAPALALLSLQRSMCGVRFGRVALFTHGWSPAQPVPEIQIVPIEPIASGADYPHFVLRKLADHIDTSHVLVTQRDGFVVDPQHATDDGGGTVDASRAAGPQGLASIRPRSSPSSQRQRPGIKSAGSARSPK